LANPFFAVFLPYLRPGVDAISDQLIFLAMTLVISSGFALLAILRVRAVAARQAGRPGSPRRTGFLLTTLRRRLWLPFGPSLDARPALWREVRHRRPSPWGRVIWLVYGTFAVGFSLLAILDSMFGTSGPFGSPFPAMVTCLQVLVGLLLLSVSSVTSLAEERASGSLDVLLTTPLTTAAIVEAKWRGSFRLVPLLALGPACVTAAVIRETRLWEVVPLVAAFILACGAAITSLGLGLATWVRRPSRAIAISVVIFVLITIGWPFLIGLLVPFRGQGLLAASPVFGVIYPMDAALIYRHSQSQYRDCLTWTSAWIVGYSFAAGVLLIAVYKTFNRCLGRATRARRGGGPRKAFFAPLATKESQPPAEVIPHRP
jgi:hypothetical protein